MYEERKESFSIKDLIIQVLFVGVFIFLLVWLFPTKNSVKKTFAPLYDQIFNQNVMIMKDAAITYYTTPRLPQNVGDEKKMTLDEMLKANLVLPFVDSKGNQCDLQESYVSITKMSDEYILKINLKCSDQEDYLLVHLGCYDYCDGDVCEKDEEKEPTPTPTPNPTPNPKPVVNYEYLYEYVLVIDGKWGEYSGWSEWTKNVITETDYRAVETKVVNETTYETKKEVIKEPIYETRRVQTGTKQEAYQDTVTVTKYRTVPVYSDVTVKVGEKDIVVEKQVPVTTKVTYYRSKTREFIDGTVKTEWSKSKQDSKLLSQRYTLTGNVKKIEVK